MESRFYYTSKHKDPHLSIFEKFKTRPSQLSTKAQRQRLILCILAQDTSPEERTRTAISKKMAAPSGSKWQTTYPGVFTDIENVMLPLGIIQEEGRLRTRRGPRVLQDHGSPYYGLTRKGMVVALAIPEMPGRLEMLETLLGDGNGNALHMLARRSPDFACMLVKGHVEEWCMGKTDLNLSNLEKGDNEFLVPYCDLLESFMEMEREEQGMLVEFLRKII